MKIFFKGQKSSFDIKTIIFEKKKIQKISKNFQKKFQKKFHDFFSNVKCVNMCDMIQIKTAKNQMSTSQQCKNVIFIAKKPL